MAFLAPISVTSTEGGGGGGREGLRRGRRGVGEASTDVTPAKRPSAASTTTSQRKKARQPAPKSTSQRKKAKQPSPPTRTSPRLHPQKDAQKELAQPRLGGDAHGDAPDDDVAPDDVDDAPDDVDDAPDDVDDAPDDVDDASGDALPPVDLTKPKTAPKMRLMRLLIQCSGWRNVNTSSLSKCTITMANGLPTVLTDFLDQQETQCARMRQGGKLTTDLKRNSRLLVLTVASKKLWQKSRFYAVWLKEKKNKIKIVKTKLKMLEKMKEEYVEHNGAEKYAQKRAKLMNTLMDVGDEDDVSPSVATEQDADDEAL
eukprot:g1773.t1 g1773   contig11:36271-37404(+)